MTDKTMTLADLTAAMREEASDDMPMQVRGIPTIYADIRKWAYIIEVHIDLHAALIAELRDLAHSWRGSVLSQALTDLLDKQPSGEPVTVEPMQPETLLAQAVSGGEGYWNSEHDIFTSPIDIGEWGARIECHGYSVQEAEALREQVLSHNVQLAAGAGDDVRDAIAKAIADVIGHGMREKCYAHADAAMAAMSAGDV